MLAKHGYCDAWKKKKKVATEAIMKAKKTYREREEEKLRLSNSHRKAYRAIQNLKVA